MGEVVGAGLISHAPTIMFDEATRRELNDGKEISLVPGLVRLKDEVLTRLDADTIVIIDSHWFTTVEHVISAHDRRSGTFTSSELPRGMAGIVYDFPGDPELGKLAADLGAELGTPTHATEDPHLEVYYATINLVHYLRSDEKIVSISVVQTGETDDFLTMGEALGEAISRLDRRVVVIGDGPPAQRAAAELAQIATEVTVVAPTPEQLDTPLGRRLRHAPAGHESDPG